MIYNLKLSDMCPVIYVTHCDSMSLPLTKKLASPEMPAVEQKGKRPIWRSMEHAEHALEILNGMGLRENLKRKPWLLSTNSLEFSLSVPYKRENRGMGQNCDKLLTIETAFLYCLLFGTGLNVTCVQ